MPSPHIVRDIRTLVQTHVTPSVSARWSKQIGFGLQAYGLRTFQSIAGNARMSVANRHTAERKAERLFRNARLANKLGVFPTRRVS